MFLDTLCNLERRLSPPCPVSSDGLAPLQDYCPRRLAAPSCLECDPSTTLHMQRREGGKSPHCDGRTVKGDGADEEAIYHGPLTYTCLPQKRRMVRSPFGQILLQC